MPRNTLNLSEFLPYLTNRLGTAFVMRFSAEALLPHDLSISMWRVLAALSNQGRLRQIDISDMTSTETSTVSRLVTKLVHAGLVSRARSNSSSREVTVALTAKGTRLVDELIPIAQRLERAATDGLAAADITVAKNCLRRMYSNLVQSEDSAGGRKASASRRRSEASVRR
jgi:MarR family transcriptional regulator, organic hydroperoxide resistance regulator